MKTRKLIDRIRALFDDDLRSSQKNREALEEVLKQLRSKEKKFEAELQQEPSPERREKLEMKIKLVRSQRKKGIEKLKQAQQSAK
ncbi:hypothetical protein DV711_07690 [Motiliproteus coralliicola]|uniref:Uncharacterized protein n=1 Tax=Motiliproteus coralliicola TaxID=2283196 RepID=A0A369WKA2_9GAMM|nr:hypothetical protein [Motiliproteus coralliicola]RDE22480.1 hypothetical protein DV711_07690 [Motiliproteus coralliicola]